MCSKLVRSKTPYIQFLFVRPRLCLRLPSDSTSRWTPLSSANSSYCQACSGLSPLSNNACRAHKIKVGLTPTYFYFIKLSDCTNYKISVIRIFSFFCTFADNNCNFGAILYLIARLVIFIRNYPILGVFVAILIFSGNDKAHHT